mmetsp:Transcript_34661/g.55774  ORF Transcript_34661/g.55774 Transcript_34661/m.55774 type:complete len:160 (-) Transcript_34661:2529-3008(-)
MEGGVDTLPALGEGGFSELIALRGDFKEPGVKEFFRRLSAGLGFEILGPVRLVEGVREPRDSVRGVVAGLDVNELRRFDAILGETTELFLDPLLELVREATREPTREVRRLRLGVPPRDTVLGVLFEVREERFLVFGEVLDILLRFSFPGLEIFATEPR